MLKRYTAATETEPSSPSEHALLSDVHSQNSAASLRLLSGPSANATHIQDQGQQEISYLRAPQGLDNWFPLFQWRKAQSLDNLLEQRKGEKKKSVYRWFFAGSQHRPKQSTHSKGLSRKRLLIVRAETVVHQEASTLTRCLSQGCASSPASADYRPAEITGWLPPLWTSHQLRRSRLSPF